MRPPGAAPRPAPPPRRARSRAAARPGRVSARETTLSYLEAKVLNAETPAHLLDDDVTPARRLFARNNGHPPSRGDIDAEAWTLEIAGESCKEPQTFTLPELRERFEEHTYQLTIECAGNGRAEFSPPATGNQWTTGAVGCPRWTGVRLRDVLEACGIADDAVYIGYYGHDRHHDYGTITATTTTSTTTYDDQH